MIICIEDVPNAHWDTDIAYYINTRSCEPKMCGSDIRIPFSFWRRLINMISSKDGIIFYNWSAEEKQEFNDLLIKTFGDQ